MPARLLSRAFTLLLLSAALLHAADDAITGVQPASLDQPRIYMNLRRTPRDQPLAAKVDKESTPAIEAFLDTGASGVLLSSTTAKALGIKRARTADNDEPVTFEDVGVAGSEEFHVSESLYPTFAPYSSLTDGDNEGAYSKPAAQPIRCQLRPNAGILDALTGGLDVAGMPAIAGKVVVIDARPLNTFTDKLKTSLVNPNDPGIPKTDRHIPLTYVSFQRFTRTTPPTAQGPALLPNPLIGPDPFKPADKSPAPLVTHNGKTTSITMLLDTGAACSMISRKQAEKLGVRYSDDDSKLLGVPDDQQFSLTVGGIGGNQTAVGFYIDRLSIPTREGRPLVYNKAPMLIHDISVTDPKTHETFTLDAIFGMNFLVATAHVTGGLLPDLGKLTQGPFTWITIDHPRATLGLK